MTEIKKYEPTLFFSYSWNDKKLVDTLDNAFIKRDIKAIRDIRDVEYKQSIKDFMSKIRETDFSMIMISDSYLKSFNCMFEILEFIKDKNFQDRVLPLILRSADSIFDIRGKMNYIKYWENKFEKEKKQLHNINPQNSISILNDINKIEEVCRNIGEFLTVISSMKNYIVDLNNCESIANIIINKFIIPHLSAIVTEPNVSDIKKHEIIIYCVVLIFNEETSMYNGFIPDLAIAAEGDTKERLTSNLMRMTQMFFRLAKKYHTQLPPSSYIEDIKKKWIGYDVFSIPVLLSTGESFYSDPLGIIK